MIIFATAIIGKFLPLFYTFLHILNFFKIFIGVELIYNVVLVSGVQQSESVIHIHISTLF